MKGIKKFEAFGHRIPEEVTSDKCQKKLDIHGREQFIQKEIDFFIKLLKENSCEIDLGRSYKTELSPDKIDNCAILKFNPEINEEIRIGISKLKDDWYLISNRVISKNPPYIDTTSSFFICDEWDEVIGYLESQIKLMKTMTIPKGWIGEDKISKEFSFRDFNEALIFIKKVAQLSEEMNHHPEINWNYDKVRITLYTHDEGKVTNKDINLAKKIDKIRF